MATIKKARRKRRLEKIEKPWMGVEAKYPYSLNPNKVSMATGRNRI